MIVVVSVFSIGFSVTVSEATLAASGSIISNCPKRSKVEMTSFVAPHVGHRFSENAFSLGSKHFDMCAGSRLALVSIE